MSLKRARVVSASRRTASGPAEVGRYIAGFLTAPEGPIDVRRMAVAGVAAALIAFVGACTARQTEGQSSVYVVLDQLSASAGVKPNEFAGYLASDVLTYVKKNINNQQVCVATVFDDAGRATFHQQLKDPGSVAEPNLPTQANTVTFTRYHVNYVRADGRNVPGVDVPYGFDGAMSTSVVGGNVSIGQLIVVRLQAKQEAPLKALIGGGTRVISTIAEITFYGTDAAGRAISVTGYINVDFSDWGDPDC